MPTAQAVTNNRGYAMSQGLDFHNLRVGTSGHGSSKVNAAEKANYKDLRKCNIDIFIPDNNGFNSVLAMIRDLDPPMALEATFFRQYFGENWKEAKRSKTGVNSYGIVEEWGSIYGARFKIKGSEVGVIYSKGYSRYFVGDLDKEPIYYKSARMLLRSI